jgi:hypothetical protein
MILEVTFWIAFIAVSRAIAKLFSRRCDVLYGSYCDATRRRRSKPSWDRAPKFNQWDSASGGGAKKRKVTRLQPARRIAPMKLRLTKLYYGD